MKEVGLHESAPLLGRIVLSRASGHSGPSLALSSLELRPSLFASAHKRLVSLIVSKDPFALDAGLKTPQ